MVTSNDYKDFGDGFVAWLLLNDFKSITKGIKKKKKKRRRRRRKEGEEEKERKELKVLTFQIKLQVKQQIYNNLDLNFQTKFQVKHQICGALKKVAKVARQTSLRIKATAWW